MCVLLGKRRRECTLDGSRLGAVEGTTQAVKEAERK